MLDNAVDVAKRFAADRNDTLIIPEATRMEGNLPFSQPQGVHAADDVVLTAMGPSAELFKGGIDNTRVFRVMATALGLGTGGPPLRTTKVQK